MTETFVTKAHLREYASGLEKVLGEIVGRERKDRDQLLADLEARIMSRINDLADQLQLIDDRLADLEDTLAPALADLQIEGAER